MARQIRTGVEIGGKSSGLAPDGGEFPQGFGPSYITVTLEKFGEGIVLRFSDKLDGAPFTREGALRLCAEIEELLGPLTAADALVRPGIPTVEYRHPIPPE